MRLVSVNTGLPREVMWRGQAVLTGIFKQPVAGRVVVREFNLDRDRQADLSVHGGKNKAVYAYPLAHYDFWRSELPDHELPMGVFGENLTVDGLSEDVVHIGDRFSVGSAELVATQPRMPCYKLGIRFGMDEMVVRFRAARRTGVYFAVSREGELGEGDCLELLAPDPNAVPISEITRLYLAKSGSAADEAALQRVLLTEALPDGWREYFRAKLKELTIAPTEKALGFGDRRTTR